MTLTDSLWLFPILFMLHNFEEMVMVKRWWRHTENKTIKSPFVRIASYPQETIAFLIGNLFLLFSLVVAISINTGHLVVGVGLALAFGLQLVGHIVEFLRFRRYMPHIVTSVLTLPYYPYLFVEATDAGYPASQIALATLCMGVLGLILLFVLHALAPAISKWLTS